MIKRLLYKLEHGDRDSGSDSSSFSSHSDLEVETSEGSVDDYVAQPLDDDPCIPSPGYESEESSRKAANSESAGLVNSDEYDDDAHGITCTEIKVSNDAGMKQRAEEQLEFDDAPEFIIKCKSVFKCRICPSVICLNEETMRAHVQSKRHARSEKLRKAGRLKAILSSDGQILELETVEEDQTQKTGNAEGNQKKRSKMKGRKRKHSSQIKKKAKK